MTTSQCVKVAYLRLNNYTDLKQWMADPNNIYM